MTDHPPWTPEAEAEINVDLESLYRAGTSGLPTRAAAVAGAAQETRSLVDVLNARSAMMGDPQVMCDVVEVVGDVYNALVASAQTLEDCAAGLIYVAEDFAAREDFATKSFKHIQESVDQEVAANPPPAVDVPDAVDIPGLVNPGDGEAGALGDPASPQEEQDDRDDQLEADLDGLAPPSTENP